MGRFNWKMAVLTALLLGVLFAVGIGLGKLFVWVTEAAGPLGAMGILAIVFCCVGFAWGGWVWRKT